jgi:arginine deiminase
MLSWYEANFNGPFPFNRGVNGQHKKLEDILRQEGVEVYDLKKKVLENQRSRELTKEIILESFKKVYKMPQYQGRNPEKDAETLAFGAEDDMIWYTLTLNPRVDGYEKYGEDPRNWVPKVVSKPVGNLYYMRDQQIVTDTGLIMGNMKRPVRKRETSITELAWESLGIKPIHKIKDGFLEGGDFMPCDEFALIGVGLRTDKSSALELMNKGALNFDEVVAVNQPNDHDRMHFDTWCTIVNPSLYLVDSKSLQESSAEVYEKNDNGVYQFLYKTKLEDYLHKRGFNRIEISSEEQKQDATNIEIIKENKIIAPDGKNFVPKSKRTNYIDTLKKYDIDVIDIPAEILLLGGGGPHCSLADVSRK